LVLAGKEKKLAYQKIFEKPKFRNDWPASIIYDCKKFKIYVDQKASQTQ
jgi:6-phosphogluconolactonase/glucosamine-6-phosphate isomerase/deaminase